LSSLDEQGAGKVVAALFHTATTFIYKQASKSFQASRIAQVADISWFLLLPFTFLLLPFC